MIHCLGFILDKMFTFECVSVCLCLCLPDTDVRGQPVGVGALLHRVCAGDQTQGRQACAQWLP